MKKNPGIGNLAELPSGSTQLRHMKKPFVEKLWKEKYPVKDLFNLIFSSKILITHQNALSLLDNNNKDK